VLPPAALRDGLALTGCRQHERAGVCGKTVGALEAFHE
jgi:hypothetical protein